MKNKVVMILVLILILAISIVLFAFLFLKTIFNPNKSSSANYFKEASIKTLSFSDFNSKFKSVSPLNSTIYPVILDSQNNKVTNFYYKLFLDSYSNKENNINTIYYYFPSNVESEVKNAFKDVIEKINNSLPPAETTIKLVYCEKMPTLGPNASIVSVIRKSVGDNPLQIAAATPLYGQDVSNLKAEYYIYDRTLSRSPSIMRRVLLHETLHTLGTGHVSMDNSPYNTVMEAIETEVSSNWDISTIPYDLNYWKLLNKRFNSLGNGNDEVSYNFLGDFKLSYSKTK